MRDNGEAIIERQRNCLSLLSEFNLDVHKIYGIYRSETISIEKVILILAKEKISIKKINNFYHGMKFSRSSKY